jgi:hypothetical protein
MKPARELKTAADFREAHLEALAGRPDEGSLSEAERARLGLLRRLFWGELELRSSCLHRLRELRRLQPVEAAALDILIAESRERQGAYLDAIRGLSADARALREWQSKRDLWREARRRIRLLEGGLREAGKEPDGYRADHAPHTRP